MNLNKSLKRTGIILFSTITLAGVTVPGMSNAKVLADSVKSTHVEQNNSISKDSTSKQGNNISKLFKKADKYISMDGNQYVLSDEASKDFSKQELDTIQSQINNANESIKLSLNNKKVFTTVNHASKSITNYIPNTNTNNNNRKFGHMLYRYSSNKVTMGWNYVRLYMNKTTTQGVITGGIAITARITDMLATVLTDGLASVLADLVITGLAAYLGYVSVTAIKGGTYVDLNTIEMEINNAGWQ